MRVFFLLLCITTSWTVSSQVELSLEECVRLAQERNLDLKSSRLGVKQAKVDLKASRYSRLPNLNGSVGASYYSGRGIDPTTNDFITENFLSNDIGLNSNVTLFQGGRINQQIKQDHVAVKRTMAQLAQTENDISLNVVLSFLNVLSGQEAVRNAASQVEITEGQMKDLQRLIEAGNRAENDILDLKAQLAQGQQNLISVQNQLNLDLLNLKQIIRWEGDEDITIVAPDLDQFRDLNLQSYTLSQLYERALETQPVIDVQKHALEEAEIGVKLARSAYFPSVTANAGLTTRYSDAARQFDTELQWIPLDLRLNGMQANVEVLQPVTTNFREVPLNDQWNQNLGYGAGVTLSIPIFNRWSTSANVQRSQINVEQSEIDLERTKDQLKRDVENAFVAAKNAERSWEAARESVEANRAAFENTEKRFEVGNATNLELTTARINYENAQRNDLTAKYTYIFNVKVLDFYIGKELKF